MTVLHNESWYHRWGLDEIYHKVQYHHRLNAQEGLKLLECPNHLVVGALAHLARTKKHGNYIYYRIVKQTDVSNTTNDPHHATILYRLTESNQDRIERWIALRELQQKQASLVSCVTLVSPSENTQLSHFPLDLKMLAVSRLMMDNVPHIQASHCIFNIETIPLAMYFGADIVDVMETEKEMARSDNTILANGITKEMLECCSLSARMVLQPLEHQPIEHAVPKLHTTESKPAFSDMENVPSPSSHDSHVPHETSASPITSILAPIWTKVSKHQRISLEEAKLLYEHASFYELGYWANKIRHVHHHESYVSYVIDRKIIYSPLPSDIHSPPVASKPESNAISQEELQHKIAETLQAGGQQILLQGCPHPDLPFSFYENMIQFIANQYPMLYIQAFSPAEIIYWHKKEDIPISSIIQRLHKAGLNSIAGTGVDILSNEVSSGSTYRECSISEWVTVMEEVHRQGIKTTAIMMLRGHEKMEHRLQHLACLRELQDRTHGFPVFIPLVVKSPHVQGIQSTKIAMEYLRFLAIARLFLDNISRTQLSWATTSTAIAQIALYFGTNDFGPTMIEVDKNSATGVRLDLSIQEIERLALEVGFIALRRNMDYQWVPS